MLCKLSVHNSYSKRPTVRKWTMEQLFTCLMTNFWKSWLRCTSIVMTPVPRGQWGYDPLFKIHLIIHSMAWKYQEIHATWERTDHRQCNPCTSREHAFPGVQEEEASQVQNHDFWTVWSKKKTMHNTAIYVGTYTLLTWNTVLNSVLSISHLGKPRTRYTLCI